MTRYELALKRKAQSAKRIKAIRAKTDKIMRAVHRRGFCSKELLDSLNTVHY